MRRQEGVPRFTCIDGLFYIAGLRPDRGLWGLEPIDLGARLNHQEQQATALYQIPQNSRGQQYHLATLLGLHLYRRTLAGPASNTHPPLVLIHGLFGNSTNFRSPGLKLAQGGRDVLLVDLRNHGQSPWSDDCSLESMADDVVELLDDEGIEQAALCGHSLSSS